MNQTIKKIYKKKSIHFWLSEAEYRIVLFYSAVRNWPNWDFGVLPKLRVQKKVMNQTEPNQTWKIAYNTFIRDWPNCTLVALFKINMVCRKKIWTEPHQTNWRISWLLWNSLFFSVQRDKENLAVITDHGVIEKLAKLADTDNDTLRAKLAQAMGNCCEWPGNRALFGGSGAVAPLVNYLGKISLVNCLLFLANCMTRIFGHQWHLYTR